MRMMKTTESFVSEAISVHGNKYDYSKSVYMGWAKKICIVCPDHGDFFQIPNNHLRNHGCPKCSGFVPVKPDLSNVVTPPGTKPIPLTKGKYAIVDADDYETVNSYNWSFMNKGYAAGWVNGKLTTMQSFIMNEIEAGKIIDHIDRNKLNNSRSNLRAASFSQNSANSKPGRGKSRFKGVHWNSKRKVWESSIMCKGKKTYIGTFYNERDAAIEYDKQARRLFGDYAFLNFG